MNDVDYEDYLEIAKIPKFCENAEWHIEKSDDFIEYFIKDGTIDEDGASNGYIIDIIAQYSKKTGRITFRIGLFLNDIIYGHKRVYQIEIKKFKRKIKDKHLLPHEHCGNKRVDLQEEYDFDSAFKHFCNKTNVKFNPPIINPEERPEDFKLR